MKLQSISRPWHSNDDDHDKDVKIKFHDGLDTPTIYKTKFSATVDTDSGANASLGQAELHELVGLVQLRKFRTSGAARTCWGS